MGSGKMRKKTKCFWDVECYRNYFYIRFECGKRIYEVRLFNDKLELGDPKVVKSFIQKHTLIGFNIDNYDLPMLGAWLAGYNNQQLKDLSDSIISGGKPWWMLSANHPDIKVPRVDGIDLIGPTPLQASLKTYACRIHVPDLQDLPITPDAKINRSDLPLLEKYCGFDNSNSLAIYQDMLPDLKLRLAMSKDYGEDFRSKSGPQIAEAVLKIRLADVDVFPDKRSTEVRPFQYKMPKFIKFKTDELKAVKRAVKSATFEVDKNGYAKLPDTLGRVIDFDGAKYKLGIGGLHSQEKHQAVLADGMLLGEWDVASMYPSIILGQGLYPDHIGPEFCAVYLSLIHI